VRRQDSASTNDIVVALVGSEGGEGEATVKRFSREGERVVLKPEHPTMAPIVVDPRRTPVKILGKVVGVLRGF
jgi:repressor LexA